MCERSVSCHTGFGELEDTAMDTRVRKKKTEYFVYYIYRFQCQF